MDNKIKLVQKKNVETRKVNKVGHLSSLSHFKLNKLAHALISNIEKPPFPRQIPKITNISLGYYSLLRIDHKQ